MFYESPDGTGSMLVRELDQAAVRVAVEEGFVPLWSVEAKGWNAAQQAMYDRLGHELLVTSKWSHGLGAAHGLLGGSSRWRRIVVGLAVVWNF